MKLFKTAEIVILVVLWIIAMAITYKANNVWISFLALSVLAIIVAFFYPKGKQGTDWRDDQGLTKS